MNEDKILLQEIISNYLHEYRIANNLTQEKMSEILHINQSSHRNLECGKNFVLAMTLIYFIIQTDEQILFLGNIRKVLTITKKYG